MTGVALRVARLPHADPALPLPEYATNGAAGMDLRACLPPERRAGGLTLAPGERAAVPTGLALAIPSGYEVQVRPRSGLALRHGVTVANAPGTIDSDYRGELMVLLANWGDAAYVVEHGARVAQMVLSPVMRAVWQEDTLDATPRGTGGFGSTGTA